MLNWLEFDPLGVESNRATMLSGKKIKEKVPFFFLLSNASNQSFAL